MPPRHPCQLTTDDAGRIYSAHHHGAWIDKLGNGNTDLDSGHWHHVRSFKVEADPTDGHTHELTMLPCGAGAAQTVERPSAMVPQYYSYGTQFAGAGAGPSELPEGRKPGVMVYIVGTLISVGMIAAGVWLMSKGSGGREPAE
jgi:hypothetical protein